MSAAVTAGSGLASDAHTPTPPASAVAASSGETRADPPSPAAADARDFADALRSTVTLADVLFRRGYRDLASVARFLDPKLADLSSPDGMVDRAAAADRLARAVTTQERVIVFGDYDCDGITSAAILTGVLRALGGTVQPMLASRFDGGYGVSPEAVSRILRANPAVLVTCDCGSSDHEQLARVAKGGADVIVIDHHLVPDEPLPAIAFLNPHRPECAFPYKGLASCGLVLSVGAALRTVLGQKLDLRQWLDLVAIGTIADVAPLDGDNRALVRAGLAAILRAERPGLRALLEITKLRDAHAIIGEDVGYRLAPRINAPGRMGAPDLALDLLLADTDERARGLAAEIDQLTLRRREVQAAMVEEAVHEIERERWHERSAIVVGRDGWNHGIVGIVAGHLARRYDKPVIVVGFEGDIGRGSVRGPEGVRLFDALAEAAPCLERFGGHQAAAGLTVRAEQLDNLREAFDAACAKRAPETRSAPDLGSRVWLDPSDDPRAVAQDLLRLEPCGAQNPSVQVFVEGRVEGAREVKGGHLKVDLRVGERSARLGGFGPSLGARAGELGGGRVVAVGRLRMNAWNGSVTPELLVEELLPA